LRDAIEANKRNKVDYSMMEELSAYLKIGPEFVTPNTAKAGSSE
jgi:hypothetical protein